MADFRFQLVPPYVVVKESVFSLITIFTTDMRIDVGGVIEIQGEIFAVKGIKHIDDDYFETHLALAVQMITNHAQRPFTVDTTKGVYGSIFLSAGAANAFK